MSKPAANPFFEADFSKYMDVSKMMDMSKMVDMSKLMGEFKMPSLNMEVIMNSHRKNIEAITTANQTAIENMQAFARRQAELARQSFEATTSMIQAVMSAPTPEEKIAKQAEATKAAMERCVASIKEMTDMLSQNQNQAMDAVSTRVCEGLDELQGMMKNGRAV